MLPTVSPYVLSTATTRSKSAQWALSNYLTVARGVRNVATARAIAAAAIASGAVAELVEVLEQPSVEPVAGRVQDLLDRATSATVACAAACLAAVEVLAAGADCARSCDAAAS